MKIDFSRLHEITIPQMNRGEGCVSTRMFMDPNGKIIRSVLPKGASIGAHQHLTNSEVDYVLSGMGTAVCDGEEEVLAAGCCHYCPKGSTHSIQNTGDEDMVLFTVVSER